MKDQFSDQLSINLQESNMDLKKLYGSFNTGLKNIFEDTTIPEQRLKEIANALERRLNNNFREYDFVLIGPKIGIVTGRR